MMCQGSQVLWLQQLLAALDLQSALLLDVLSQRDFLKLGTEEVVCPFELALDHDEPPAALNIGRRYSVGIPFRQEVVHILRVHRWPAMLLLIRELDGRELY